MWICLNNAFISIVTMPGEPDNLLVRARRPGDLEAVFPGCAVVRTPKRDYLYRTVLPRAVVGLAISQHIGSISYPNFKNSVQNDKLHDAYGATWVTMAKLQAVRPYANDSFAAQRIEYRFMQEEGRPVGVAAGASA